MEPAIPVGSLILTEPIDPDAGPAPGEVVTLRLGADRAPVTHRVIRTVPRDGAVWLELQGDANAEPDPVLVPATAVIGRVTTVWPALGRAVAILRSGPGFLVLAGLGGLLYALSIIVRGTERPRTAPGARQIGAEPRGDAPRIRRPARWQPDPARRAVVGAGRTRHRAVARALCQPCRHRWRLPGRCARDADRPDRHRIAGPDGDTLVARESRRLRCRVSPLSLDHTGSRLRGRGDDRRQIEPDDHETRRSFPGRTTTSSGSTSAAWSSAPSNEVSVTLL